MRLKVVVPVATGVLLFLANWTLLGIIFYLDSRSIELTYGRGSWWVKESFLVKAVYVGLIAPFLEELIFRRLLLDYFMEKKHAKIGLLVSSACFGLWHLLFGWGPLKAADMTLVGLVFGIMYTKFKFRGSLLAHYANNLASVFFMGLL